MAVAAGRGEGEERERRGGTGGGEERVISYTKTPLKSNGDLRVVMDYRPINGIAVKLQ